MIRILKKYKSILTIIIILILIIGSIIIRKELDDTNIEYTHENIEQDDSTALEEEVKQEEIINIFVDIKGAVNSPGVYEVESNKRVIDVVNMAGGLRDDADTSFINLAKKLEDSMVIIIYTEKEIALAKDKKDMSYVIDNNCVCPTVANDACIENNTQNNNIISNNDNNSKEEDKTDSSNAISNKININTASIIDLQTLPGIGESKAKSIIEYRDNNGAFNSIDDIKKVSGIGDSLYEKIKEYITV